MKKILILSDLPDLVRFQKIDYLMIRQIYVILFLLNYFKENNDTEIYINDRSGLSYNTLWKNDSKLYNFINPFLINESWDDIVFLEYDLIICQYGYEIAFYNYLFKRYHYHFDERKIYSLINPRNTSANYLFTPVNQLFRSGGLFEVSDNVKTEELAAFKKEIVRSYIENKKEDHEKAFEALLNQIIAVNQKRKNKTYKRILILDDYNRNFYIGDTTIWYRFFKKAIRYCGDYEEVIINCNNPRTYQLLYTLYQNSFGKKVSLSNKTWDQISLNTFDLIILETDLILKFLSYITPFYSSIFKDTSIYTITPLKEELLLDVHNWDFYNNHKKVDELEIVNSKFSIDKEIFISEKEQEEANSWLEQQGLKEENHLFVVLNDSAKDKKVLLVEEFIAFIKKLIQVKNVKILLFGEKGLEKRRALNESLTIEEMHKVIFSEGLGIRKDMGLLASKFTKAIIGPCTGMLHLANGIFTYLFNHQLIKKESIPFMLVYTGRQEHDIGYLPKSWWNNSLVECAVIVNDNDQNTLINLEQSPGDTTAFNALAADIQSINAEMLFEFFIYNFSKLKLMVS